MHPLDEMQRLTAYLGLQVTEHQLAQILANYQNIDQSKKFRKLHFNKGISGRYQHEMTREQIAYAEQLFAPALHEMGYT